MATLKQVTDGIISDLSKYDTLPRFVGIALHSETLDRIFTKGIGTNGAALGTYAASTISQSCSESAAGATTCLIGNPYFLANS